METNGSGEIGSITFTTTRARRGNNKTFRIYSERLAPEGSVDVQKVDGLNDNMEPPQGREGWTSINQKLGNVGTQAQVITFNCLEGKMRSPLIAGLYMIHHLGMSPGDALQELKDAMGPKWALMTQRKVEHYLTMYAVAFPEYELAQPGQQQPQRKSRRLSAGSKTKTGQ